MISPVFPGSGPLPAEYVEAIERVRPRLTWLVPAVQFFEEVGSTNDVAAALASSGTGDGRVVLAERQTAGRGRLGRRWHSPPGGGLYASVVVACHRARTSPDRVTSLVTLAAGVAIAEAVEAVAGLRPDIKWPNDLEIGGRKVAGILAEGMLPAGRAEGTRHVAQVVLGYGINVGPATYPAEIAQRATSLESELGRPIERAMLFAETLAALDARGVDLLEGRFDAILDAWRRRAPARRGVRVAWETPAGVRSGVTEDVDPYGALLVRTRLGVERLIAGEVRWARDAARD